jgi:lambda family phage minor tail protein L
VDRERVEREAERLSGTGLLDHADAGVRPVTIRSHVQGFALGARVYLYELDLTEFGLGIVRITPSSDEGTSAISFGTEIYAPHPVKAEGFELNGSGSLPRPTFTVSNLDNSFTALVEQNDDLHGGILRRIRTYDRYLDTGAEPDGNSHLPIDVYQLSQKTTHTRDEIAWSCSALMDQEGVELPGRTVARDYCGHDTRRWNAATGDFDYTNVTCPYVGPPLDADGNPCAPSEESFSKRLGTCCMARFGRNAVLPTRAFPGIARLRSR